MGNKSGKPALNKKELRSYQEKTHFDENEVRALYEHFKGISATETDDGVIDRREFQRALGLKESLYLDRFFQLFDENNDGFINFQEFILGLSILSSKGSQDEKMEFSFKIYDFDGDGKICREELMKMLDASSLENELDLTPTHMEQLVTKTFHEADKNGDGFIDYEEYKQFVKSKPSMMANMTINVSQRIKEEQKRWEASAGMAGGSDSDDA